MMFKKCHGTAKMMQKYKKIGEQSIHKFFHSNTSLNHATNMVFTDQITDFKERIAGEVYSPFKNFEKKNLISLLEEDSETEYPLMSILEQRVTKRNFTLKNISFRDFSIIMKYTFGIKSQGDNGYCSYYYPCAGGFNSLRAYIKVERVENLYEGMYLYIPTKHALCKVDVDNIKYEQITTLYEIASKASFSVHIVGDMQYIGKKYSDRAYRFMNLEAGHAMQNLYLVTTALNLGCVASGGFLDDDFEKWLNLEEQYLLYEAFVGGNGE